MNPEVWNDLAPMLVAICLILTVGGVLILRPLAKRFGELLEMYAKDKEQGIQADVHQMRELLETMNSRLQLMEERQDFTERLVSDRRRELAPPSKEE
jgi:predicted phage tail protein